MEILPFIDNLSLLTLVTAPLLLAFYTLFKDENQFLAYASLLFLSLFSLLGLHAFFFSFETSIAAWFFMMFLNFSLSLRFKKTSSS